MIAGSRFARPHEAARALRSGSADVPAKGKGAGVAELTRKFIRGQPVLCLGLAIAAGAVLGWLIKQR